MESALSRLVVLRQPGLTFAGLSCPSMSRRIPVRAPGREGIPRGRERVREACKASETGNPPARLANVGDRVEILFGRLEPAFFFYDGVTSDDDSQ